MENSSKVMILHNDHLSLTMDKKQWSENSGFFSTGTRVFLVMAECGNLSEASSVLDMHPSTISYHLSELEKSLNLPLFDHSKRPLKLTSEGLNLYNELKYHFSSLNVRVQKLRQKNFLKPVIRIGIIESLSRRTSYRKTFLFVQ